MKLPKIPIPRKLTRLAGRLLTKGKYNAPEIMTIAGLIVGAGCVVASCKSTLKADPKVKKAKKEIKEIKEKKVSEKAKKHELTKVKTDTAISVVKDYALPAGLGVLSVALIWGGNRVLRKRLVASTMAYAALYKSYQEYRGRVVKALGEDREKELYYGKKLESKTVVDEATGEVKTETKLVTNGRQLSPYARVFNEGCWDSINGRWLWRNTCWRKSAYENKLTIKRALIEANNRLKADGFLFLNTVYQMLGMPLTYEGQIVGWTLEGGDGFVDFGVTNGKYLVPGNEDFINELTPDCILDFNVDGVIVDKLVDFFGGEMTQKLMIRQITDGVA